jgi:hypothetical protein
MRFYLTRITMGRAFAHSTRRQATEYRDRSALAHKDLDTLEVKPTREFKQLVEIWAEMAKKMEANDFTPGEMAVHRACMQDLIDRIKA